MYRKFITTVSAAAIALTAIGTTRAAAGEHDTARIIAGLLGLAVVGKIIHDNKKDRNEVSRHQPAPVYEQPPRYKPTYVQPTHKQPHAQQINPRPLPQRANRKVLPRRCLQSFQTRRGEVRMFGKRCLKRHSNIAHRLPQQCQYAVKTRDGVRRGYAARCLRDRGYRLARG